MNLTHEGAQTKKLLEPVPFDKFDRREFLWHHILILQRHGISGLRYTITEELVQLSV